MRLLLLHAVCDPQISNESSPMPSKPSQQSTLAGKDRAPHLWHIATEKCIMLSGRSSLTMNSYKHTSTGWWLSATIASGAGFTLVCSHILRTTWRSKSLTPRTPTSVKLTLGRIILATIRQLGRCPCPRCLIPLDRVANMGMPRDMKQRITLARVDDVKRRNRVEAAREAIYVKNYGVDSQPVKNLLQEDSLVPTVVWVSSPPRS